jgi:hypothetical protein
LLYIKLAEAIAKIYNERPPSAKKRWEKEMLECYLPRKFKLKKEDVKTLTQELSAWGLEPNPKIKKLFLDD